MKRYLITGASMGLGRALARALVERGDRVWGVARTVDALEALRAECGPERFEFSGCDVSSRDAIAAAVDAMARRHFEPDVVFLNAAINPEAKGLPFDIDTFEAVLTTNVVGALRWVDAFLPAFRARGHGQFVAVSSLAAYRGDARWVAYCASKAALTRSFEAFRGRHTSEGVSFTTVHLGAIDTGMGAGARSPFRLSPAKAADRILAAVDRRASTVTIPRPLRLMVEALRVLPDPAFSKLVMRSFVPDAQRKNKP